MARDLEDVMRNSPRSISSVTEELLASNPAVEGFVGRVDIDEDGELEKVYINVEQGEIAEAKVLRSDESISLTVERESKQEFPHFDVLYGVSRRRAETEKEAKSEARDMLFDDAGHRYEILSTSVSGDDGGDWSVEFHVELDTSRQAGGDVNPNRLFADAEMVSRAYK